MKLKMIFLAICMSVMTLGSEPSFMTFDAETFSYRGNDDRVTCENLIISFKNDSKLSCGKGDFSQRTLEGVFFSGVNGKPHAVYSGKMMDQKGTPVDLHVESQQMKMTIKEPKEGTSYYVQKISIDEEVMIKYQHRFLALGDQGSYACTLSEEIPVKELIPLESILRLSSYQHGKPCYLTDQQGSEIYSSEMVIYPVKHQLIFNHPQGNIDAPEKISFKAKQLLWQDDQRLLVLKEDVGIQWEGFGYLKAQEVHLQQTEDNSKQLKTCTSLGETEFTFVDEVKGFSHTLKASGLVVIDHQNHKVCLDSLHDDKGNVLPGKQVNFHDYMGAIFADTMNVDYALVNHKLIPKMLRLEGNVRMRNQFAANSSANSNVPLEQYAVADIVTFDPSTLEMVLSAYPKKRVLFFDKINNIQASAPSLTITRDPITRKESIKGKGDVRFIFAEQESERIRQQFSQK